MKRHKFVATSTPGIVRCACGVQRMVVVRIVGVVTTFRGINLFRYPAHRRAAAPRGIIHASGWTEWSTHQPPHVR